MSEVKIQQWASIYANEKILCVVARSGLRRTGIDPDGFLTCLAAASDAATLGRAIASALAGSRFLSPDEIGAFFNLESVDARAAQWERAMMQNQGETKPGVLFKNMKLCLVSQSDASIIMSPCCHEKLKAWSGKGLSEADNVVLPAAADEAALGDAALLALSRCL